LNRLKNTLPLDDAVGEYFRVMVTTSGEMDLFRFLYDRALRNLRRIEAILNGERDPGQMPQLYKKTADILNYLLLLYEEQMGEYEDAASTDFVQLHRDMLESITDFAWDMDRERIIFCREILAHVRRELGNPVLRIPRHEAVLEAPPPEIPSARPAPQPPAPSGIKSAAAAVEQMPSPSERPRISFAGRAGEARGPQRVQE